MTTQSQTEALKMAISHLEWFIDAYPYDITTSKEDFLRPLKEALSSPNGEAQQSNEQVEPVAISEVLRLSKANFIYNFGESEAANWVYADLAELLYTHPPVPTAQPEQFKPLTDEQKSILNFLLGADDFEGVCYGDKHPHKKGAFWWRDELRKAFQPSTKENGPTGQNGAVITSVKPDVTWKLNELYTMPPQRKPLTFEQVEDCFPDWYSTEYNGILVSAQWLHDYARAVEAAVMENMK